MTDMISGVDFIGIASKDLAASAAFYEDVLGLPRVAEWGPHAVEFQAGNLTLAVMDSSHFKLDVTPNNHPIAFHVDDLDGARERLEAENVKFVTDTFDSGVCHQAVFLDPDGNALILHHRYAPKAGS